MRRTQMIKRTSLAAWLSPWLTAASLVSGGLHSLAAADGNLDLPFSIVGENCPIDDEGDNTTSEDGAIDAATSEMPQVDVPAVIDENSPTESGTITFAAEQESEMPNEDQETSTEVDLVEEDDVAPHGTSRELSPRMDALRSRVREALAYYHRKQLNTRDNNPWEVMHSIVAYGVDSQLHRNGPDGQTVNAISWLCWNGDCKGTRILEVTGNRLAARKGPQVQGHPGQLLAILAQSNVATNAPIKVGDKHFTLEDLIESEKSGCQGGTELTFKLISLSHYLDSDARWKSADGQNWSIERLVRE